MGFAPIVAWQNDFESTLVPCFLFACCVTVSAIGDHFEGVKMAIQTRSSAGFVGVTTSRATSGGRRKDRNTSGQRRNRFNKSYRDISVIAAETNSVVKPSILRQIKC